MMTPTKYLRWNSICNMPDIEEDKKPIRNVPNLPKSGLRTLSMILLFFMWHTTSFRIPPFLKTSSSAS